jgi:hypothetical protein
MIGVTHNVFDRQVSFLVHICNQFSPLLSAVERLDIQHVVVDQKDDMDHVQWLENFHPFIALQTLHIGPEVVLPIASVLQELVMA